MRSSFILMALFGATAANADIGNVKWANQSLPVKYQIATSVDNAGGMTVNGGLPYARAVELIQAALASWTSANVISCPGPTSWNVQYTGQFSSPAGTAAISGNDNINRIIFLTGANWTSGSMVLAESITTFNNGTPFNRAVDGDIRINNNHPWSEPCPGVDGKYDLITTIAHEGGHFLGFTHSSSAGSVMLPTQAAGYCLRSLSASDIHDVCTLYPPFTCSVSVTPAVGGPDTTFTTAWESNSPACTWALDGASQGNIPCSGSTTFKQAVGSYAVTLNAGSTNCNTSFSVVAPPTCSIAITPATGEKATTFTANWNSSGTSCEWDFDGTPQGSVACTGTNSATDQAIGKHTLNLRAVGPGGSTSCAADYTVFVDGACTQVGTVCRPAVGSCDVAETCEAIGSVCPSDKQASDGTACSSGACQAGICQAPIGGGTGNAGGGSGNAGGGSGTGGTGDGGSTASGCTCSSVAIDFGGMLTLLALLVRRRQVHCT